MVAISVNNLIKKFGDKTAVSIPDFCFPSNEIIGLVGNNGAGKTTLFRLILNLIKADSGIVNFCLTDENSQRDKANLDSNMTLVSHLEDAWKSYIAAYLDESFLIEFLTPKEFFTVICTFYYNFTIERCIINCASTFSFHHYFYACAVALFHCPHFW